MFVLFVLDRIILSVKDVFVYAFCRKSKAYFSMENGELTPLDKLLYYESPGDKYVKVNGEEADETTFLQTANQYTEPSDPKYLFTDYYWKSLRTMMEDYGFQLSSSGAAGNSTDIGAAAINIDDYVGDWRYGSYINDYDTYERNLSISKLEGNQLSLGFFYWHECAIDCEATLNGNIASFAYKDASVEVKGTLIFNENSITVKITYSNFISMPAETMTFDRRDVSDGSCSLFGREITYGNSCDCTWCDVCNAWMGGHGHGEGELEW